MLTQCSADPRQSFILIGSHPEPLPSKCPDHTPDNLKRVFLQSANALKGGDPDASGTMSRKVFLATRRRTIPAFTRASRHLRHEAHLLPT
jgi:hypothetical protein